MHTVTQTFIHAVISNYCFYSMTITHFTCTVLYHEGVGVCYSHLSYLLADKIDQSFMMFRKDRHFYVHAFKIQTIYMDKLKCRLEKIEKHGNIITHWSHVSRHKRSSFDFGYLALQKLHVVRLCTAILSQLICLKQQSTDTNSVDVRTEKEAKLSNERS